MDDHIEWYKPATHIVQAGTPLHCNREDCKAQFPAPVDLERTSFSGMAGARVTKMVVCPVCHRPDGHWVLAIDVMPAIAGTEYQRRTAMKAWMRDN